MAEKKVVANDNDELSVFETKGFGNEEVVFEFEMEEGCEKLFAPRSFLALASPVFKAMLKGNFKESGTGVVKITDFSKKNFLEFLLCFDPGTMKGISESNVLEVLPIADKYDVDPLKVKCINEMLQWLKRCHSRVENNGPRILWEIQPMLNILHAAVSVSYENVIEQAIANIARCGSGYFAFETFNLSSGAKAVVDDSMKTWHINCVALFEKLPTDIQIQILKQRLLKKDDNNSGN